MERRRVATAVAVMTLALLPTAVANAQGTLGEGDQVAAVIEAARSFAGLGGSQEGDDCDYSFESREWVNAQDLTGDGYDEILEYQNRNDCDSVTDSVSALAGPDGTALWTRSFGVDDGPFLMDYGVLIPAGDLDGAPGDDLIEIRVDTEVVAGLFDWTLTYSGVSGVTGQAFWTRTYRDPWTAVDTARTSAFAEIDYAIPLGLADATGDGRADLLVGRYNTASIDSDASGSVSAAVFEVLSGDTGLPAAAYPAAGRGPGARPTAAFTSGGGAASVVTVSVMGRDDGTFAADVTAYPGAGGSSLWRGEAVLPASPRAVGAELTGDGTGDVILTASRVSRIGEPFERETRVVAISGTQTWTFHTSLFAFPHIVPDVTGDGGEDLLLLSGPSMRGDWLTEVSLLDGDSGSVVWSRSEDLELAGDVNADGVEDVVTYFFRYDPATRTWLDVADLVSGMDGSIIWTFESADLQLRPTGADGNANGTADLVVMNGGSYSADEYRLVEGANGSSIWSEPRQSDIQFPLTAVHLEGPADDLLEISYFGTTLRGVSGENGRELWQRTVESS